MLMSVLLEDVPQAAPHVAEPKAEPKPEPKVSPVAKVEPEPKGAPVKKPESPPSKGISCHVLFCGLFIPLFNVTFPLCNCMHIIYYYVYIASNIEVHFYFVSYLYVV